MGLNRPGKFTWLATSLLFAAGVFIAWQHLLPKPTPPPVFFWLGAPAGWFALISLRVLSAPRLRHPSWPEIPGVAALFLGSGIFFLVQWLWLHQVWPVPTVTGLGTCLLGWLVLPRISRAGFAGEAKALAWMYAWMDVAVLAVVLWSASALREAGPVPSWSLLSILGIWALVRRWPRWSGALTGTALTTRAGRLALILAATFLMAAAVAALAKASAVLAALPGLFAAGLAGLLAFHGVQRWIEKTAPAPAAEMLALVLVLGGAVVLTAPLLTFHPVGAGDAEWYATMLHDAITQFRSGIFPVYIGQTPDAFNGSIFPFALGPYFLYLGGLLDLLTLHSLGVFAVMHLAAALSLLAGMFVMYGAVRKLGPGQPLLALAVAWLYGSGAAVLSPLYTGDMYLTQMALPWIALSLSLALASAIRPTRLIWVGLGASVGIACWAHFPDAMWTGLICAGPPLLRLVLGPGRGASLRGVAWAGLAFVCISGGYFTRVLSVLESTAGNLDYLTGAVMQSVHSGVPAALLPVSAPAAQLTDFQLGYSLWALLVLAVVYGFCRAGSGARGLIFFILVLLAMVLPVPHVTEALWKMLPARFVAASDVWPMIRLYLVVAPAICLVGGMALANLGTRPSLAPFLLCALGILAVWNAAEAGKFLARGRLVTNPAPSANSLALEANRRLTTNSFHPYFPGRALPHYYSEGTVDPLLALRLLDRRDPKTVLRVNEPPATSPAVALHAQPHSLWPVIVGLGPPLTLPPHSRWILRLHFPARNYQGRLHFQGRLINQQHLVAAPGGQIPSGWSAMPSNTIMLRNDGDEAEVLNLLYYPLPNTPIPEQPPANSTERTAASLFADIELLPYRADDLPMAIESFLPLRVRVEAPENASLETFRIPEPGYRARINGQPVTPQISPDHLVMVPVPAGRSVVELEYRPSWLTRAANWLSLATLLTVVAAFFRTAAAATENPRPPATAASDGPGRTHA